MVYSTWLNTTSEARTAMSFDECPRQSVYKAAVLEFPMNPKEARNDPSGIGDHIYSNLVNKLDGIMSKIPGAFKKTVTADLVIGAGGAKPVSEYRATLPGESPSHNVDDAIKALIAGTTYSYHCENEVFSDSTPKLPTKASTAPRAREDTHQEGADQQYQPRTQDARCRYERLPRDARSASRTIARAAR